MRKAILLPSGSDLVGRVCELIESSGAGPERSLVLLPSRRPFFALAKRLAERRGAALMAPHCYSIDQWVEKACSDLGMGHQRTGAEDGAALIYQMHPDCQLPGGGSRLSMEEFLAWGFTLFSDFEELKIEGVSPKALESVRALAQEPMPGAFGRQLEHLSVWYDGFYRRLEEEGLATRASAYDWLASRAARIDTSGFAQVIVAGFNALTAAERSIIGSLLDRPNAVAVFRDGPGMGRTFGHLGIDYRPADGAGAPRVRYLRAGDSHGQVAAMAGEIVPGQGLSETVLVLSKQETVFPVIHHLLPRLGDEWNISMGYPLMRTPLWGLAEAIAQAQEGRGRQGYFLPHYLQLMLHPYVKNLRTARGSYPTRILLHAIEEELTRQGRRMVGLDFIESDPELRERVSKRMAGLAEQGLDTGELFVHLAEIHGLVLRPFENAGSVAEFAERMLEVVSAAAERSQADRHPYANRFFLEMTRALLELKGSLMAGQRLGTARAYFGLMQHYAAQVRVPFPGTSFRGLQVLGFLETRNLRFKKVVMLDANEGTLPKGGSVDTILPQALRRELGLPTYREREMMDSYHFHNLVAGAEEAVLCYSQAGGEQRSRFVEQLVWEEEQRRGAIGAAGQTLAHFGASFCQGQPQPIAKTQGMMETIAGLSYSPTMIDRYLRCGLRFCHSFLMRIREKDEMSLDVEASDLGGLVHRVLHMFFEKRKDKVYSHSKADPGEMDGLVDEVFDGYFGPDQGGNIYLIKSQVRARMRKLLRHHQMNLKGLKVIGCELKRQMTVDLPGLGPVPVNGTMDRVDLRGDQVVILDYKTGGGEVPKYGTFVQAQREDWANKLISVQLPFYMMLYLEEHQGPGPEGVNCELMKLGEPNIEQLPLFSPEDDRRAAYQSYRSAIATLIGEIRNPDLPFREADNPQHECANCPYKVLCGRQWVGERK